MNLSEEKRVLLSQLVDGELPVDQANQVLAEVFDELAHVLSDSEVARELSAMLKLRETLDPWRRQEPPQPVVTLPAESRAGGRFHFGQRVIGLASAAMLGGALVAGGFLLGNRLGSQRSDALLAQQVAQPTTVVEKATGENNRDVVVVTPKDRQEIARVFALHESVAGPLSWYAADESTIQVAPARKGEMLRKPIAVVLRLTPACFHGDSEPKTYVIVCRNNDTATIELPQSAVAKILRLRLLSTASDGRVNLKYAIAADGSNDGADEAALAGSRHVGLDQTSLGQLALSDCLVNVDASAWVIQDQCKL